MALFHVQGLPIGGVAIMLALVASMGGFIFGYDTGQISDIVLMDDFLLRFSTCTTPGVVSTCSFTPVREGLIVALLSIGTLVGALAGAPVADFLGRRYAMSVECIVFIIGVIIQITSTHVWQQVAVGRLVSGLAVGSLSAAVPMYQGETAPPQIRGTLTATYQLFITLGIFVAYCIGIGTRSISASGSWRTLIGIGILWPLILGFGILLMPESPRWLAMHNRLDEAKRSIAITRGIPYSEADSHPVIVREVEEIRVNVLHERKLKGGWIDCFKFENRTLYRTLLGMSLQSFQQLTGCNYFLYYGSTIFQSVGISDSFVTQIILGLVNFVCTFGSMYVMERFGRRLPLIIGSLWMSAWLFIFASVATAKPPQENPSIGKLMIASVCLFLWGFATTWGPGVWIIIGEAFPTRTRAKQGALATASNWLWNFLLAFFTPFIVDSISFRYGYVFAACNLAGALIVYLFVFESSDLSLENVDAMYCDPECKPWSSHSWAPAGYRNRNELIEQTKAAEGHKALKAGIGAEEVRFEKADTSEHSSV